MDVNANVLPTGKSNIPTTEISVPPIRSSSARDNKGTNVCIPYARIAKTKRTHSDEGGERGEVVFMRKHHKHDLTKTCSLLTVSDVNKVLLASTEYKTHTQVLEEFNVDGVVLSVDTGTTMVYSPF